MEFMLNLVCRQFLKNGLPDAELHETTPPEDAIALAISMAGDGDAVLWAGPGHQRYREISGVRTPFDAPEIARMALRAAGWPTDDPQD